MSEALKAYADRLHSTEDDLWQELRTNPDGVIDDPELELSEEDRNLLRQGPRKDLLKAADRPADHLAPIMVWLK